MAWSRGDVAAFRHLCGERCWFGVPVYVVKDTPELVALYLPGGAPFRFVPGPWPTETGLPRGTRRSRGAATTS